MPRSRGALLATLDELDAAIVQRRRYLRQTELQIADVIDRGNSEILALNYDVKLLTQAQRDLKINIRLLKEERALLQEDVIVIQQTIVKAYV